MKKLFELTLSHVMPHLLQVLRNIIKARRKPGDMDHNPVCNNLGDKDVTKKFARLRYLQ